MGDAATDGGLPDAGEILAWDAGGSTAWQVKAVNPYLLTDPVRLAAHPSAAATLAALPAATEAEPNMVVYTTSDGLTWLPETIMSFTGSAGFFGTPLGLAYDPQAPTYLVAALEPVPPPSSGLAVVLAWSGDGGSSFSHPWDPWTQPWPPDDMRYVDGSPAELVWRAGASFFFESAHGTSFARSETLSPLPAGCSAVTGFDLPRDDHDTVAIWCTGGDAHQCDLLTGACTALPIGGAVRALRYAPGDPSVIYALTTDRIWRSADGGVSFNEAHVFSADQLAISAGNAQVACALDRGSHELRCTRDGGQTWMDLTPPLLQGPDPSEVLTLAFSADGSLWAVAHPGVIQHPAP
jgi:hypothetical protein